jgi:hypothetical protein
MFIECATCDEGEYADDCPDCHGTQQVELTRCVFKETASVVDNVQMFELWLDRGLPPLLGGVLDQTAWFVNSANYYQSQRGKVSNE